jgi:hypothetical protein
MEYMFIIIYFVLESFLVTYNPQESCDCACCEGIWAKTPALNRKLKGPPEPAWTLWS